MVFFETEEKLKSWRVVLVTGKSVSHQRTTFFLSWKAIYVQRKHAKEQYLYCIKNLFPVFFCWFSVRGLCISHTANSAGNLVPRGFWERETNPLQWTASGGKNATLRAEFVTKTVQYMDSSMASTIGKVYFSFCGIFRQPICRCRRKSLEYWPCGRRHGGIKRLGLSL